MDWLENWRGSTSMRNATSSSLGGAHRVLDQDNADGRTVSGNAEKQQTPQSVQSGNVGRDEPRGTVTVRTKVCAPAAAPTQLRLELATPSGRKDQPMDDKTSPTGDSEQPPKPKRIRIRFRNTTLPNGESSATPGILSDGNLATASPPHDGRLASFTPPPSAARTPSATPRASGLPGKEFAQTETTGEQELDRGQRSTTLQVQSWQTRGSRQDLPPPESSALEVSMPTSPVSVASFDSAVAAAFFPGSDDPTSGSPSLRSASGSAKPQMVEPFQHSAAARTANFDKSMVSSGQNKTEPPNHNKRFVPEEDAQLVALKKSGLTWRAIATHLGRTKSGCETRFRLLREKARLAGQEPPDSTAATTVSPSTTASTSAGPAPASSSSAQTLTATAPPNTYTAGEDVAILRMYLQGESAEGIGTAIDRSTLSVHRRWTEKRDEWIASGILPVGSRLKLHDDELPSLPIVPATTAPLPDPFAILRSSTSHVMAGAEQDVQASTSWDGTDELLLEPETTETDLGGFDTSFFLNEDPLVESTLPDVSADSTLGTAPEVPPPPQPQIQAPPQVSAAATLGSRQESPLVPTASKQDSSTPEMAAERMLSDAMPHYKSGMEGLNRFLRLVNRDGKKRR